MLESIASATVPAPPERVWDLLCDTTRYADWVAGTDAVPRTDGPAQLGSTYDEVNPIAGPWKAHTTWRVVEHDPPRRTVHATDDIPLMGDFRITMEVAPEGAGSRVTLSLRGAPSAGPAGALFARVMKPGVDRDNRRSLEQLAALLAREAAAPAPA